LRLLGWRSVAIKTLVIVSGIHDVPERVRKILYVVGVNTWGEAAQYMSGRTDDIVMYWSDGVPGDCLLKSIEDYRGGLLVYAGFDVGAVMMSRFTRTIRGKRRVKWVELGKPTELEDTLMRVQKLVCG
jgi:hypothetical protein